MVVECDSHQDLPVKFQEGDACVEEWPDGRKLQILTAKGFQVRRDMCGHIYYVLEDSDHGKLDWTDMSEFGLGRMYRTSHGMYVDPSRCRGQG